VVDVRGSSDYRGAVVLPLKAIFVDGGDGIRAVSKDVMSRTCADMNYRCVVRKIDRITMELTSQRSR
jgi:hypothetical protein